MCDIVTIKCYGCGVKIDCHLGDFSVDAHNVKPFCHKASCRKKAMQVLLGADGIKIVKRGRGKNAKIDWVYHFDCDEEGANYMVFSNVPRRTAVYKGASKKKAVLFLVDVPHGVSTNG